jgi:hypothetical protein
VIGVASGNFFLSIMDREGQWVWLRYHSHVWLTEECFSCWKSDSEDAIISSGSKLVIVVKRWVDVLGPVVTVIEDSVRVWTVCE